MSTQNIFDEVNLPTSTVLARHISNSAMDLMNYLRFELGCVNHEEMREALRLKRLICSDLCYITDCDKINLREDLITLGIRNIEEI